MPLSVFAAPLPLASGMQITGHPFTEQNRSQIYATTLPRSPPFGPVA